MHNQFGQINNRSKILFLILIVLSTFTLTASQALQPPDPIQPKTIFILTPATDSILQSPINLQAEVNCNPNNYIRIELIENNRNLLYRKVFKPEFEIGTKLKLDESIFFDTNKIDSKARLTISLMDDSSRYLAISSAELILSKEKQTLLPTPLNKTDFQIISPHVNSVAQGGVLLVNGWINPTNTSPVILELTLESGRVIGSRQILIHDIHPDDYHYFEVEIPYNISGFQSVRLTIRQMGEKIPGNVSLESEIIQLGP